MNMTTPDTASDPAPDPASDTRPVSRPRSGTIAAPSATSTDLSWSKPGPGSWVLDRDHTGPTPSRPVRDLFSEAAAGGMAEAFELLGGPLETMRVAFVNGRFYRRLVPAVAGERDGAPPPAAALWVGARIHPTLRRRERTARRALADRIWLEELARWESEWRPQLVTRNLELTRVDLTELDDDGLAAHLDDVWQHLRRSTALHFRLHGSDVGPIGLLLAQTDALSIDRRLVFDALAGASPATNAPAVALASLRRRIETATAGTGAVPRTLQDIRALDGEVSDAVDDFVDRYGWRLTTGYDFTDRTLVELPGVIEAALTAGAATVPDEDVQEAAEDRGRTAVERLVDATPPEHREQVRTALDDARRCYGLRDENGPLTFEWPAGVLRRALLEAGRRLRSRGALHDPTDVFDATIDETAALLRGAAAPSADELGQRHDVRRSWESMEAPDTLGPEEQEPPLWALPRGMRLLTRATLIAFELLGAEAGDDAPLLHGMGVGDAPYRGTARVVSGVDDAFDRVEPGDVLVVTATVPTFNAVLALAGAVVVEEGGMLSHAAVMARELGFAAVIGASGATTAIPDGAVVEVDPAGGVVRILG